MTNGKKIEKKYANNNLNDIVILSKCQYLRMYRKNIYYHLWNLS